MNKKNIPTTLNQENKLVLRELTPEDEKSFFKGVEGWAGESLTWFTFDWKPGMNYIEHLDRLQKNKRGAELKEGLVPSTMLYAFVNGEIVGRINIRHNLNEHLEKRGGHIGYSIAPRFRRNGYATQIMQKSFPYLQKLNLQKILVTCSDSNIPSWKIIEHFGGVLENKVYDDKGELIRRYWLDIPTAPGK